MNTELFQTKLQADDGAASNEFGYSVSISGNRALVGVNAINGAYLFERQSDGSWTQVEKLTGDAYFGRSVSLDENTALVGTTGSSNAAYVFERQSDGSWPEMKKLTGTDGYFGWSVSVSGNFAIVGNWNSGKPKIFEKEEKDWKRVHEETGPGYLGYSVSIDGNFAIAGIWGSSYGARFLELQDGSWTQVHEESRTAQFGRSVSISGNFAIVGDYGKEAAYLFERRDGKWQQVEELAAREPEAGAQFGWSVSIDGNLAIVGANFKKDSDGNANVGVAYVFQRQGQGNWVEIEKLQAEGGQAQDQFGYSVALDQGLAIVGAIKGDGIVTDTGTAYVFDLGLRESNIGQALTHNVVANDADAGDDLARSVSLSGSLAGVGAPGEGNQAGAAYIFEHSRYDFWEQMQKVVAYDREPNDDFGRSISLDGNLVAVGAPNKGEMAGAVYLFKQEGDCCAWQLVQKLMASDHEPNQYFGQSVWLDESIVMVGAPGEGEGDGAVYVFEQSDARWEETKKLTSKDRGENLGFGKSVSLDGNLAIVGADVDNNERPGAAYFFTREEDGSWTEGAKVQAFDSEINDHFGHSVYLNRGLAIVGAHGKDSAGPDSGAAYIFRHSDGNWQRVQKIMACDRRSREQFGYAVSLNGSVAAVSSFDSRGRGSNGAVYLFQQLSNGLWVEVKKLVDHDHDVQNHFGAALSQDGELVMIGAAMQDAGPENAGAAYITQYEQRVASGEPTKMASGSTEAGNTNWQLNAEGNLFVQIDTSAVAFSESPKYFTTLNGDNSHEATTAVGVTSIENASKDGFQLTLLASELTPEQANERNWHINWFAVGPDGVLPYKNA